MEEDLRARAIAATDGTVAKTSIAWGDRPQGSALPGVTFDYIDDARPQHMTDFQAVRSTQVQVDCWSNDKLEARDIRELLIAALVPAGVIGSTSFRRSFVDRLASSWERLDDSSIVYRERIDFSIWHSALS